MNRLPKGRKPLPVVEVRETVTTRSDHDSDDTAIVFAVRESLRVGLTVAVRLSDGSAIRVHAGWLE